MLTTANWKARKADDILSQTEQPPLFWDDDEPNGSAADGSESCSTDSTDSTESVTEPANGQASEPEQEQGQEQEQPQSQPLIRPLPLETPAATCDEAPETEIEAETVYDDPDLKALQDVTDNDVLDAIRGTLFGEITELFTSVTTPALPVGAGITKAIGAVACALSGSKYGELIGNALQHEEPVKTPDGKTESRPSKPTPFGKRAARVLIGTGTGQVANAYVMLIAPPSSGKDIGGILKEFLREKGWLLGDGGSSAGMAQEMLLHPNGLLMIPELQPYIKTHDWHSEATSFLTKMFSEGSIQELFSSKNRNKGAEEFVVPYAYPSIIANIQPDIFARKVSKDNIGDGFISRFLIARMELTDYEPTPLDFGQVLAHLNMLVRPFEGMHGLLQVPLHYTQRFAKYGKGIPEVMTATWRRLTMEYYPRLALMLSLAGSDLYRSDIPLEAFTISEDTLKRAETLVLWFYRNAYKAVHSITDNDVEYSNMKFIRAVVQFVARACSKGKAVLKRDISQNVKCGLKMENLSRWRDILIEEMVHRAILTVYRGDEPVSGDAADEYRASRGDAFRLGPNAKDYM